jgi:broad specificity phosphatase PhoE
MSTRFLLVRHAQTDFNRDGRFRGWADVPLNEIGRSEAGAAARRIEAGYHPAAIYCGPLQRTRSTAEAIADLLDQEIRLEQDLIDLNFGTFAGLSHTEAERKYPQIYRAWRTTPETVRFPEGESLADVRSRTGRVVAGLAQRHPDEQIVLVSHMDVIRVLLCNWLGLPLGHIGAFQIHTASLSVVDVGPGEFSILTLNDTHHLQRVTLPSE